jgi:hypothetical protein
VHSGDKVLLALSERRLALSTISLICVMLEFVNPAALLWNIALSQRIDKISQLKCCAAGRGSCHPKLLRRC